MSENVIWKAINLDGVESTYDISNTGQVRNRETDELRSLMISNTGYYRVILYRHGIEYPRSVHRLVAEYFVSNPDPMQNTVVDHKDGNKLNNHYTNLEWVTPKENKRRAVELGLDNPRHGHQLSGSDSGVSKHTEMDAHLACMLLEQGLSNKIIADLIEVDTEFVRTLRRGTAWIDIVKMYDVPLPEKRSYYPKETRDKIKQLIDDGLDDVNVAMRAGIPEPERYGRKYVYGIRRRYIRDKGSTTIPLDHNDQQE